MYVLWQAPNSLFSLTYGYVICLGVILLISVVTGMMSALSHRFRGY